MISATRMRVYEQNLVANAFSDTRYSKIFFFHRDRRKRTSSILEITLTRNPFAIANLFIIIFFSVYNMLKKLNTEKLGYKLANLTYKLLEHYLGECNIRFLTRFDSNFDQTVFSKKFPPKMSTTIIILKHRKISLHA